MADENQDESQKTEEPTERRLKQARDKGEVAKSQEINHWFIILAFAILLALAAPFVADSLAMTLRPFLERPHDMPLDPYGLRRLVFEMLWSVAKVMSVIFLAVIVAALAAGAVQTGLLVSAESLKPKLSKISLKSGFKRLFSAKAIVEFIKGLVKLAIVATVIGLLLWPERDVIEGLAVLEMGALLHYLQAQGLKVLGGVLAVMTVIAALDFMFQKQQHMKKLRMSRQDLKDEYKQTDGDPQVKQRLRQLRMERSRRRMMAAVPEADVVVTNPTHYAVALAYRHGEMSAPRVVAKGVDALALRIREVAKEHEVQIVENPPLARALYAGVELDQEVPPEHYKAVAEVIGYVMRLSGKTAQRGDARG